MLGSLGAGLGSQVALIASGVIAARTLGPMDRGYLALLVLLPTVFVHIGSLGVPLAVTYYLARYHGREARIISTIVRPAIIQAGLLVPIHAVSLVLLFSDEPTYTWPAALASLSTVPAMLAFQYALAILQGSRSFRSFNSLRVLPATLYSLFLVGLVVVDMTSLTALTVAGMLATFCSGGFALARAAAGLRSATSCAPDENEVEVSTPSWNEMAGFGIKSMFGYASPIENYRVDQLLVGLLLAPALLGLYVVATAFTNLPRFLSQSVGIVAYPYVAAESNSTRARTQMWKFVALGSALAGVASLALVLGAPWLVVLFFGKAFSAAVPLTQTLLVAGFLFAVRRVLTDAARGLGYGLLGSIGEVGSLVVLLVLVPVALPVWGLEGVVFAVCVAAAGSVVFLLAVVSRGGSQSTVGNDFDGRP